MRSYFVVYQAPPDEEGQTFFYATRGEAPDGSLKLYMKMRSKRDWLLGLNSLIASGVDLPLERALVDVFESQPSTD